MSLVRNSVKPTYDSRETGPRFHVTTEVGNRMIGFRDPVPDPFVRQAVTLGWKDLLRGLWRAVTFRELQVIVMVGADPDMISDVLELDANTLVPGSTRQAAFRSHLNEVTGRTA